MSEKNNIITTLKLKQNGKNKITTRKRSVSLFNKNI